MFSEPRAAHEELVRESIYRLAAAGKNDVGGNSRTHSNSNNNSSNNNDNHSRDVYQASGGINSSDNPAGGNGTAAEAAAADRDLDADEDEGRRSHDDIMGEADRALDDSLLR